MWFLEKGTIHTDKVCPPLGKSANRATEHFGGPMEKKDFTVEAKTRFSRSLKDLLTSPAPQFRASSNPGAGETSGFIPG